MPHSDGTAVGLRAAVALIIAFGFLVFATNAAASDGTRDADAAALARVHVGSIQVGGRHLRVGRPLRRSSAVLAKGAVRGAQRLVHGVPAVGGPSKAVGPAIGEVSHVLAGVPWPRGEGHSPPRAQSSLIGWRPHAGARTARRCAAAPAARTDSRFTATRPATAGAGGPRVGEALELGPCERAQRSDVVTCEWPQPSAPGTRWSPPCRPSPPNRPASPGAHTDRREHGLELDASRAVGRITERALGLSGRRRRSCRWPVGGCRVHRSSVTRIVGDRGSLRCGPQPRQRCRALLGQRGSGNSRPRERGPRGRRAVRPHASSSDSGLRTGAVATPSGADLATTAGDAGLSPRATRLARRQRSARVAPGSPEASRGGDARVRVRAANR